MIQAIYPVCCGLDVHKESISATLLISNGFETPFKIQKLFSAFTYGIDELASWLLENKCNIVFMESTSIYWKPVFFILKKYGIECFVLNPYHIKAIPGKKSDKIDSDRIAHLSMHGLVKHSYVPEPVIMNLRTLTRARFNMMSQLRVIKTTISRILDESNVKFNSVASDLFGVSGKIIMKAIIDNPDISSLELVTLVKGKLNNKKSQLVKALDGKISKQNLFLLPIYLKQLEDLQTAISKIEISIKKYIIEHNLSHYIDILCSIPSIKFISAAVILSEIGIDMSAFNNVSSFSSWAGVCPGNNISAGKSKSSKISKSNKYLKSTLVQCCWSITRSKKAKTLSSYFFKLQYRRGAKKAIIALAHKVIRIIYSLFSTNSLYCEEIISRKQCKSKYNESNSEIVIFKTHDINLQSQPEISTDTFCISTS